MASNFWTSTHYKELKDPEEINVVHPLDAQRGISVEDFRLIKLHMSNYISKLAQHIKIRQRVVATAITYMRRVYTRKSLKEYEPRLVAPTCLYLACKAEESVVHAKILVFYVKKNADEKFRYEIKDILAMEMKILEALNFYLVVFHPYRSMPEGLVNDTYRTDLILIHPPFLITLACIYIASVHKEKDIRTWFEELSVDMNIVKNIAMEILDFYENHRLFTEERVHAAFNKLATNP